MRFSITVHPPSGPPTDCLVEVDEAATIGQLRGALARTLGISQSTGLWMGTGRVDDAADIATSPLHEGAIVALVADPAATPFVPVTRGWTLHVTSGRDSGLVSALPLGDHILGRGGVPPFSDRSMSRRHAILRVTENGATIADLGSSNGTTVDGQPVPADGVEGQPPAPVVPGQVIGIGDTLLTIVPAARPDAAVEPGPAGVIDFTRPPRLLPSSRSVKVVIPVKPGTKPPRKFPLAAMGAPLAMGVIMAVVLHQPQYLIFTMMSPIMAISNYVTGKRTGAKDAARDQEKYRTDLEEADKRLASGLVEETKRRRAEIPDASETLLTATLPGRRLWERRRHDLDAFVVRVGVTDLPARLQVVRGKDVGLTGSDEPDPTPRTVFQVPATLPLRDVGVLGVAGPLEDVRGLVRWLVLQVGVHHGPRDASVTILAPRSGPEWNWVRWLPHARPQDLDAAVAMVGFDNDTVGVRVSDLAAQVKARQAVAKGLRADRAGFPAHIVVIEGARSLRAVPGLAQILADGPAVGVIAICVEAEERLLPEECTATVVIDPDDPAHLVLRRTGEDDLRRILGEQVSEPVATAAARAIAPMRDVSSDEEDSSLPDSARLLDVMSLEPPTVDAIRARWQFEGRTTRMAIGYGSDGVFALDLRRDGPHGLIAGTTGSGKSELLQTIIASLAIANRPDAMNFVLIDYKGGSAFKDCVALPHTVGMVTDLDAHLVERALTSLGAELKRREHQLADAAVKDIEDYLDLSLRQPGLPPLPRLLIVIDEFASMARELPDFVKGLVNIAQRGRSLGIHLLLATQRPSGVVSPEIRANTNLRISLRVTDGADSTDVLESPDAARIPKSAPGRGYVRLGAGVLQPFQAGRVGGRRPGVKLAHAPEPFVTELGWGQLGYPTPKPTRSVVADDVELTDLSVLVGAVTAAAQAEGLDHQRTPWLPALADSILLSELPPTGAGLGDLPPLPFGIEDLPADQVQQAATFDLTRDGHLLAVGAPRSGRSQLLRTLAAAASALSVADLHLYGIDCGNGALLPLTELPHCGAVVSRTQTERASRLMGRLLGEVERRQALLADQGFADITEQRRGVAAEARLPHLMVMIDRWEGFTTTLGELDGGRLLDAVMTMMREGASVGVHLVITGDRSLGSGRISSLTENKMAFRLADRGDYSLLGLNYRQLPDEIQPGRAYCSDTMIERQIGLVARDPSGQAQAAALAALGAAAKDRCADVAKPHRPFRVDVLPGRLTFAEAWAMRPADTSPLFGLVGVGGDELAVAGVDFASTSCFVVAGPAKSGRSTVLSTLARSLTAAGSQVILAAPRPGPLRALAGSAGVLDVITEALAPVDVWQAALEKAGGEPVVVIIDDGEGLKDSPAGELFRAIIKGNGPAGQSLVLGGNADGLCTGLSGWQVDAKKSRHGVLLSPQGTGDGELIGVRLARSSVGGQIAPGRGLLHVGDGRLTTIAVPAA